MWLRLSACVVLACFAALSHGEGVTVPLPVVEIVKPPDTASPAVKAFSGVWSGSYRDGGPTGLIVQRIDETTATVYYFWTAGDYGGYSIHPAEVRGNVITFPGRNAKFTLSYELLPDGTLNHRFLDVARPSFAVLKKMQ